MDIIQNGLSLAPVPYLATAFSVFRFIWASIQQVKGSRGQLQVLASYISQLLCALDTEFRRDQQLPVRVAKPLQELCSLLQEIDVFVRKQSACHFLKALFKKDEWISQIAAYHQRIQGFVTAFQISAHVNITDWQAQSDRARMADQQILHDRLTELEGNLAETLDIQHNSVLAMMAALQRRLNSQYTESRESQFYKNSLQYLCTVSGTHIVMEDWIVSAFDVDFGSKIGEGGFGTVFKGTWNKLSVALKVLMTDGGISPTSAAIRREIKIWSSLHHPHILQFLGANILDDKPFIVMPFMKNGNARDYIDLNPDCNRQRILYHISLGLVYLHARNIVHGDLKSLNILIDDAEKAVLCDFGLSRMKADIASRTVRQVPTVVTSSRNWMAPERLKGGSLKKPCDIYAFGMMIYEIHTNEIPLGDIEYSEFIELVVNQNVRPERPDSDEAPQMADDSWHLAELCWRKDPYSRPNIGTVCDTISRSLDNSGQRVMKSQPVPTPPVVQRPEAPVSELHSPPPPTKSRLAPHTFQETCRLKGHTRYVYSVAFSPSGERIVSGSGDHTVLVWDWRTERVILGPLLGHTESVLSVAYSPDGQRIVSGSSDHTAIVWGANGGQRIFHQFKRHRGPVTSVAFSPDSTMVASGSDDQAIQIWEATTGKLIRSLVLLATVQSITFSPNGQYLVSGTTGGDHIWEVESWKHVWRGRGDGAVAVSPDSKHLACRDGREVYITDLKGGEATVGPTKGHEADVWCIAFSPDGMWIASGSVDETIRIWDTATGNQISCLAPLGSAVRSIAISPSGLQMVASCWNDNTIHLYS